MHAGTGDMVSPGNFVSTPFFGDENVFGINNIKKNLGNEPNFLRYETKHFSASRHSRLRGNDDVVGTETNPLANPQESVSANILFECQIARRHRPNARPNQ